MMRPYGTVFLAASLDGFIARRDGAIDWLSMVERPGEDYGSKEFFSSVDTIVMGRKTYDIGLTFPSWPYASMRCVVVTSDTTRAAKHGETFYNGPLAKLFEQLALEDSKRIYIDGGTIVAQALAAGLVDEVIVSVIPVLLGEGTPLAPAIGRDVPLALTRHEAFESGLVQLRYRVR